MIIITKSHISQLVTVCTRVTCSAWPLDWHYQDRDKDASTITPKKQLVIAKLYVVKKKSSYSFAIARKTVHCKTNSSL